VIFHVLNQRNPGRTNNTLRVRKMSADDPRRVRTLVDSAPLSSLPVALDGSNPDAHTRGYGDDLSDSYDTRRVVTAEEGCRAMARPNALAVLMILVLLHISDGVQRSEWNYDRWGF